MGEKVDPKALKLPKDPVSEDRNWTLRVNSELDAEGKWNNQWGYYAKGTSSTIQGSLLKKLQLLSSKKNRILTIELIVFLDKSKRWRENCSRLQHNHMELEIMWNFTRTRHTISMKIVI